MNIRFMTIVRRLQGLCTPGARCRAVIPALSGGILLGASFLPWLLGPLGASYSAWQLPLDLGWQIHTGLINYGVLCFLVALYAFFLAWRSWHGTEHDTQKRLSLHTPSGLTVSLLCLLPGALLLFQYLCADMGSVVQLTRQEMQMLLIRNHFGYGYAAQFAPLQPATFSPSSLNDRLSLLLDQCSIGLFLPMLSALLLFVSRAHFPGMQQHRTPSRRQKIWLAAGTLFLLVVFGRSPLALASDAQAEHLLAAGDYASALTWLDRTVLLNPSFDQLPSYHIERGQALYYQDPAHLTIEGRAYLASFYRQQNDFLSAYQELLQAQHNSQPAPWLIDEQITTLERLAEMTHPLNGTPALRLPREEPPLTWLSAILQIDPANVYGHYMIGRIKYDLHDYAGSETQMLQVISVSKNTDIQSSAYTYMALDSEGRGDMVMTRQYLFRAQELDPEFRNNTAREEISGLR